MSRYTKLLSKIQRERAAELRAAGRAVGPAPFGMRTGRGGVLEREPREQRIIAFVLRQRREGRTYPQIVAACKARGYTSRAAKPLGLTQIVRIVKKHQTTEGDHDEKRAA